ncbi:MAG TPA: multicopper oxidase domain-containing protein [Gemmatimonadales bacterium]|jgi:FtsP/CotA-like multicopper oxidase with cupredoxin domain|nr:multicopper oxidase domain-containing protein [Gemmatimonadales bacterium]
MRTRRSLLLACLAAALVDCTDVGGPSLLVTPPGRPYVPRTRVYYIAAEDVDWNFAPLGSDPVFGQPLPEPWGVQTVYPKQRYVQYTDATFTTPVPQPAWQGILGPMIRGVVGDTLKVVFRNKAQMPFSMHPHGVRYDPADEGAVYDPPRGGGDAVPPGGTFTYTWFVRPESGPLPWEPSSKVWLYHSHVEADQDIYRGLVGTIVITSPAHARADGGPDDVDREFTTFWMVFNENTPETPEEEQEGNLKHAINGYFFGNLPGLTMRVGDRVRWYVVALGTEVDMHTPHWHGAVVQLEGRTYTDVVELAPASMKVADMVADNPGTWLLHCHVADHMMAGMYTTYAIGSTPSAVAQRVSPSAATEGGWHSFHDLTGR